MSVVVEGERETPESSHLLVTGDAHERLACPGDRSLVIFSPHIVRVLFSSKWKISSMLKLESTSISIRDS